jgi:hypothetical protein
VTKPATATTIVSPAVTDGSVALIDVLAVAVVDVDWTNDGPLAAATGEMTASWSTNPRIEAKLRRPRPTDLTNRISPPDHRGGRAARFGTRDRTQPRRQRPKKRDYLDRRISRARQCLAQITAVKICFGPPSVRVVVIHSTLTSITLVIWCAPNVQEITGKNMPLSLVIGWPYA